MYGHNEREEEKVKIESTRTPDNTLHYVQGSNVPTCIGSLQNNSCDLYLRQSYIYFIVHTVDIILLLRFKDWAGTRMVSP